MDPNANLQEQRRTAAAILAIVDAAGDEYTDEQRDALAEHARELAELVQALDSWITLCRGARPADWERGRP